MNSIAQQAVPKGMGQIEDRRPHFTTASRVVVITLPPAWTPGYVGSTNLPLNRSSRPIDGTPSSLGPEESAARLVSRRRKTGQMILRFAQPAKAVNWSRTSASRGAEASFEDRMGSRIG